MRSFLIVLESKHKAENVRLLLKSKGVSNFDVVATEGRLFDLDKKNISVDDDFNKIEKPLNEKIINSIRNKSEKYSDIVIATDLDSEGEKIANDILMITKKKSYKRINPENLTEKKWEQALSTVYKIDSNEVKSQESKRIFDRILGYQTESLYKEQIGRVISPVLSQVEKGGFPTSIFEWDIDDEKKMIIKASQTTKSENEAIASTIESMSKIDTRLESEATTEENLSFWTGEQALINVSIALNVSMQDAFDSMQRLYEGGLITYFRTDRCKIELSDADDLKDLCNNWGVNCDDLGEVLKRSEIKDSQLSKTRLVHGGHGALIPTKPSINPYSNTKSLTRDEKVLLLITRHSMRCMRKPAQIHEKKYSVPISRSNNPLNELRKKLNLDISVISRKLSLESGRDIKYYPELDIEGINLRKSKVSQSGLKMFSIPKDVSVAMIMYRAGLGRPSTMSLHSTAISERMLTDNSKLNRIGEANLTFAKNNYPKITEKETYSKLDDIFRNSDLSVRQRVINALSFIDFVNSINDKDISIDIDIDKEIQEIIESENPFLERDRQNERIKEKERMRQMLINEENRLNKNRSSDKSNDKSANSDQSDLEM